MELSAKGEDLIKGFEGLYLHAYLCPAGKWTISWGCTSGVKPGMVITKDQAETMFQSEMATFEAAVNRLVHEPLSQHEFDALCSFSFNCGVGALQSSTLLKKLNAGNYDAVPAELMKWDHFTNPKTHKSEVSPGLEKRRKAEGALWLDPDAPSVSIAEPMPQIVNQPMEAPMTATTPAAIVTTTTNAVNAAVQSATLSIGSLWTQITGFIGSVAATGGLGIFATVAPTTTTAVMASIVAIATAVSAAAHVYSIVTGVSAANNATIMLVENFLNTVETGLGGKPLTFDNGTPAATA